MDLTCSVCRQKFESEAVFTKHFVTKHTAITLVPQESTSNSQKQNIDKPVKDSKFLSTCWFKRCEICGYHSSKPNLFASHIVSHIGAMPYFCQFCTFSTISRLHLQEHISSHERLIKNRIGNVMKTYKSKFNMHECESCTAMFSNCTYLTLHFMQHLKKMPFKCNFCMLLFAERKDFIIHNHLHKVILECDMCQSVFSTRADYLEHVLSHNTSKVFRKFDKLDTFKHILPQSSVYDKNYLTGNNINDQLFNDLSHKYGNSSINSINRKENVSRMPISNQKQSTFKSQFDCSFKQYSSRASRSLFNLSHKDTNSYSSKIGAYEKTRAPLCKDASNKKESCNSLSVFNLNEHQRKLSESHNKLVKKHYKAMPLDKSSKNIISSEHCNSNSRIQELSVLLIRLPRSVQSYRAFCRWNNQLPKIAKKCQHACLLSGESRNCNFENLASIKNANFEKDLSHSETYSCLINSVNYVPREDQCFNDSRNMKNKKIISADTTNLGNFDESRENTKSFDCNFNFDDSVENIFIGTRKIHNKLDISNPNNPQRLTYVNKDNNDNQVQNCKQVFVLLDKLPEYVYDMPSFKRFLRIAKQKKNIHDKFATSKTEPNSNKVKTVVSKNLKTNFKNKQVAQKNLNLIKKNAKVKSNSLSNKTFNTKSKLSAIKPYNGKSVSNFMFNPSPVSQFQNDKKTHKLSQKSTHQKSSAKNISLHVSQFKELRVQLHRLPDIVCETYKKHKPLMISNIFPEIVETESFSSGLRLNSNKIISEHNYFVPFTCVKKEFSNGQ